MKEEEKKEYNDLIKRIDDIEFIPDDELKNMDFYELAYYMQTLNQVTSIDVIEEE